MEGNILHERADDPYRTEKRNKCIISSALPVSSERLGITGILDVVEWHKDAQGISIPGRKGLYRPRIVEYKRGKFRGTVPDGDKAQVTAQVMCLEEELGISIREADLFYFGTRTRIPVEITEELRENLCAILRDMHHLYEKRITPPAQANVHCSSCSMKEICMPRLTKKRKSISSYIYGELP